MSLKGKAYIMGAWEHPTRDAPDKTTAQLHFESARGALADAGLAFDDVDGYFCAGDAPGCRTALLLQHVGDDDVVAGLAERERGRSEGVRPCATTNHSSPRTPRLGMIGSPLITALWR